jgi:hypothetical protein
MSKLGPSKRASEATRSFDPHKIGAELYLIHVWNLESYYETGRGVRPSTSPMVPRNLQETVKKKQIFSGNVCENFSLLIRLTAIEADPASVPAILRR